MICGAWICALAQYGHLHPLPLLKKYNERKSGILVPAGGFPVLQPSSRRVCFFFKC